MSRTGGGGRVGAVRALVGAWLVLDFFGDARRRGEAGSATLTTSIFTQSFVAFLLAAFLFDDAVGHTAFAAANLSLTSLLIAFALFGDPPSRDRRIADLTLLSTAPGGRTVARLARIVHGTFFLVLITTGTALPATVLTLWTAETAPAAAAAAHLAAALLCGGLVAGAAQLALGIASAWSSNQAAALAAGSLRALILGGGFVSFAVGFRHLRGTVDDLPVPAWLVQLWPGYQGARWAADPSDWTRPAVLVGALAGLLALAGLVRTLGAGRDARPVGRGRGPMARLGRRLAAGGGPERLGMAEFTARMLLRSPGFRARVLPLFGLPAAMAGLAAFQEGEPDAQRALLGAVLQFPAIYLPFLVLFLPIADEPRAAHVFRTAPMTPGDAVCAGRTGSLVALTTRILVPTFVAGAALLLALGIGPLATASICLFGSGLAVLVAEFHLRSLGSVPFSEDGQGRGRGGAESELGGLMVFALVLAGLGGIQARFASTVWGVGAAAAIAVLGWSRLAGARPRAAGAETIAPELGMAATAAPTASPAAPGAAARHPSGATRPDSDTAERMVRPETSLRRELAAIGVLYLFSCILPVALGLLFDR